MNRKLAGDTSARAGADPVVAIHGFFILCAAIVYVQSTIAVANFDGPPRDLTFKYSPDVRSLCYASVALGGLITSLVLGLGWTIPITLMAMVIIPGFTFTANSPADQQEYILDSLVGFLCEPRRRAFRNNSLRDTG